MKIATNLKRRSGNRAADAVALSLPALKGRGFPRKIDEAQRFAETMASSLIGAYPKVEVPILEIDTDTYQLLKVHKVYGRLHLALKTYSYND